MESAATAAARKDGAHMRLPTNPRDITPDFMSDLISRMHRGTRVKSVQVLESLGIGGMVSTAGRGKIQLQYDANPRNLPERVLVKMIVDKKSISPPCMYETEVRMYERLLADVPIEKPLCLAAAYETDTQNFMLVLEDISLRGARFTNILQPPLTPTEVGTLLDTLAAIHAHFWESPVLDREKEWLSSQIAGPQFDTFNSGFLVPLMEANVAESPYRADFIERSGQTPAKLWEMVKAVHRHFAKTMPMTLCHGDTGAHNTFRLPDGRASFVDWQLSVKGGWPHDVHYLVVTSLSVKDRRAHERSLIERYLRSLKDRGVRYAPSLDDAMREYALGIIWGLTIGWFSVPSSMYGMEIISANIERLFAAATDHNLFKHAEKLL
jgi:hypothetical protein